MAASQKLAEWLLDNSSNAGLQVSTLTWPQDWKIERFNDVRVSLSLQGQNFFGRGTADNELEAISKAAGEALERAYTTGNKIHSTGVALHVDEHLAKQGARLEFIERSSFFAHFYGERPFLKIEDGLVSWIADSYGPLFEKFSEQGVKIGFYQPAIRFEVPVVLCVAEGLAAAAPWGGTIGLSAKETFDHAAISAFFECARSAAGNILQGPCSLTLQEFGELHRYTSLDRQRLASNPDYWRSVSLLFPSSKELGEPKGRKFPAISLSELRCPFAEIEDAPVFVYRASPETDIDIHNADPKRDPALLNWLSEISGWRFEVDALPAKPHFLG